MCFTRRGTQNDCDDYYKQQDNGAHHPTPDPCPAFHFVCCPFHVSRQTAAVSLLRERRPVKPRLYPRRSDPKVEFTNRACGILDLQPNHWSVKTLHHLLACVVLPPGAG